MSSNGLESQTNHHNEPAYETPITLSVLQTLSTTILIQIFRHLDRGHLTALYETSLPRLRSAANLVLTEQLALGISEYHETEACDVDQIRRQVGLCGSIKGLVECEEREEIDVGVGLVKKEDMERSLKRVLVGGELDVSKQGVKRSRKDVEELKQDEDGDRKSQGHSNTATDSLPTNPHSPSTSSQILPDELLLPILEPQTSKLLKTLLSSPSPQLRRVSETVLFARRRGMIGYPAPIRGNQSFDWKSERRWWRAVSEKGEEWLGRRFVLRNCGWREGGEGLTGLERGEEEGGGKVSLGSFWRVVCEDVDVSRAVVRS